MAVNSGQTLTAQILNASFVSKTAQDNEILGNLSTTAGAILANTLHATYNLLTDASLTVKGEAIFTKIAGSAKIYGEEIAGGTRLKLDANEVLLSGTNVNINSTGHMVINGISGGNVGIGTATPATKLHVVGDITSTNLYLGAGGTQGNIYNIDNLNGYDSIGYTFAGVTTPSHYMTSAGLTLGAYSTPTEMLEVHGDVYIMGSGSSIGNTTIANAALKIGSTMGIDSNEIYCAGDMHIGTIGAYSTIFRNSTTELLRLTNTGNIGISTSSPNYKLDITGTLRSTDVAYLNNGAVFANGQNKGVKIGSTIIDEVTNAGKLAVYGLDQLRFGTSTTYDWNQWAGIKYNSTTYTMYIGGPAGSQFTANTSPSQITIDFKQGVSNILIDKTTIDTLTIGNTTVYDAAYTAGSVFTDTAGIRRAMIKFTQASGSGDPGVIYHETSSTAADVNKGVIHICPTDDNDNTGDYVSIHGTNDTESIKLFTGGLIQTTNQFKSTIATGTAPLVVSSTTTVANLSADLLDGVQGSDYLSWDGRNDTNFNANTAIGNNRIYRPGLNATNLPSSTYGTLLNLNNLDTNQQVYLSHGADSSGSMYFRTDSSSAMDAPWRRLWHDGDATITATTFSGNATSASKWATARTITLGGDATGSVSLDGASNVTLNVTVTDDSHLHDTNYVKKAGDTVTGLMNIDRIGKVNNGVYVPYPKGGEYKGSGSVTGALKIKLPQSWTSTMMQFVVDIYNYGNDSSSTYYIGGYNYSGTPAWTNTSAYSLGFNSSSSTSNYSVRFGHDGTNCCILIGEITTVWSYPQVIVRNFFGGHTGAQTLDSWDDGWAITFETVLPTTVSMTISSTLTKSSYAIDADKIDGLHSASLFRTDAANACDVRLASTDGRGMRFWDSESYKIYMSTSANATYGGRGPNETTSDYNMYFKMSGGTNRGWVFRTDTAAVASIDSTGTGYFSALKINGSSVLDGSSISTSVSSTSTTTVASSSAVKTAYDKAVEALNATTSQAWSTITGKPTTISGYGITDAYTKADINTRFNETFDNFTFSGGAITPTANALEISVASSVVYCGGQRFAPSTTTKVLTASTTTYVYVNSSGVITTSTTAPTGDYISLATITVPASGVIPSGNIVNTRNVITNAYGTYTYDVYSSGYAQTITQRGSGGSLLVKDGSTNKFLIDSSGNARMYNGADLLVYSDEGTTQKFSIDGATGNITTGGTITTASDIVFPYTSQVKMTDLSIIKQGGASYSELQFGNSTKTFVAYGNAFKVYDGSRVSVVADSTSLNVYTGTTAAGDGITVTSSTGVSGNWWSGTGGTVLQSNGTANLHLGQNNSNDMIFYSDRIETKKNVKSAYVPPINIAMSTFGTSGDGNAQGDGQTHIGYNTGAGYSHYFRGTGTMNINMTGGISNSGHVKTSGEFILTDSPSSYSRWGYEQSTGDTYFSNKNNDWLRLKGTTSSGMTFAGNSVAMVGWSTAAPSGTKPIGYIWIQY